MEVEAQAVRHTTQLVFQVTRHLALAINLNEKFEKLYKNALLTQYSDSVEAQGQAHHSVQYFRSLGTWH